MHWGKVVGFAICGIIGGCFAMYPIDSYRMKEFCKSVHHGENAAKVRIRAEEIIGFKTTKDFHNDEQNSNSFIVHSPWSFGRFTCTVNHIKGDVLQGEYSYLD